MATTELAAQVPRIGSNATRRSAPPSARVPEYRFMREDSPWRRAHGLVTSVIVAIGCALAVVSWVGLSGENTFREQSGWLVLAVFAAVISAIGMSVWLLIGFREVRCGEREIVAEVRRRRADREQARRALAGPLVDREALVTTDQMTRFHWADCRLVRAKAVTVVTRDQAAERNLQECGVCRP
jgi:hypothetical protein